MTKEQAAKIESKLGFDRIRKEIADRCSTEYACERAENESFVTDSKEIRHRQLLCDEMRLILMFEESFPISGYVDCRQFLKALTEKGVIDLLSLGKLRTLTETLARIKAFFYDSRDSVYPNLRSMTSAVTVFPEVRRRIDQILDKYGEVRDSASDELFKIRNSIKEKEKQISKRMTSILKYAQSEGYTDSDASVVIRDGKMLIPVSSASKRKLKGFIYDESASGKTTFIEPAEVVEIGNELNELHFAEEREIYRILSEYTEFLRPYIPELIDSAVFVGEIDFIISKARTALEMRAGMPIISEDGSLHLRNARHPLLEKALSSENRQVVPLTLSLTPQKHILLISGPNAGGKSVCLKTTGLLQYMFQWGLPIPCSEVSELPIFENIVISIGDDQSIDNDLSTYSSFLADMRDMLAHANSSTLVLIDEFGSGTEPAAGGAIAEAILSELDSRGVYGVITTHYTNLKLFAAGADTGVVNGAMLFDGAKIAPLFKLEMGLPGNSFAFELARKMGLPEDIVKSAEEKAGDEYVGMERNLRKIARSRKVMDEKLQRIKTADRTLENITEKYEKELLDIKKERAKILEEARREAEEIIRGANKEVEKTIRTIKESQAEKESTAEARESLRGFIGALGQARGERDAYIGKKLKAVEERKAKDIERKVRRGDTEAVRKAQEKALEAEKLAAFRNAPLQVGEKVRFKATGMVGEVAKVTAKAVVVVVGNISTKASLSSVERISSNEFKSALKEKGIDKPRQIVDRSITERKLNFSPEIDVRGMRVNEAIEEVVRYIDDALMVNMDKVRIIHGKGTGALREELQRYLRTMSGVESVSDESIQLGGTGVTIVKLS